MPGTRAGAVPPEPADLARAAAALRGGRPVILPTDTVYGVAVLASTPRAAGILASLKHRSADQPSAVLVADVEQALSLVEPLSAQEQRLIDAFWPGPLTLVLRRRTEAHGLDLGGDGRTVGVRCPDHPVARELTRRLGPLVTTSANRHGDPTPDTAAGAADALTGPVEVVVDGGTLRGQPSTVVDCTVDPPKILRPGAVSEMVIQSILGPGSG